VLSSVFELRETFGFYFRKGIAAERFFASPEIFNDIVRVAREVPGAVVCHRLAALRPSLVVQLSTGGNAALMAEALAEVGGVEVSLYSPCWGASDHGRLSLSDRSGPLSGTC
jgi:hypothetical protein